MSDSDCARVARPWISRGAKELYNRCNPRVALSPNDPRNVDVDARDVRGENWAVRLAAFAAWSGLYGLTERTSPRGTCSRLDQDQSSKPRYACW